MSAALTRLGRVRVTLAYATALAVVATVMLHLGPGAQQRVIEYTSTNLHNLSEGRISTLVGSAFVNEARSVYLWLPGLVALLALGELLWHSRRLVVAFAVGHIGATLLVAIGIAAALGAGLVSASIVDAADVGMSYGAVAVLGTFTAAIPQPWRPAWTGAWLAMAFGAVVLTRADFTADGHAIALVLGMAVGSRFGPIAGVDGAAVRVARGGSGFRLPAVGLRGSLDHHDCEIRTGGCGRCGRCFSAGRGVPGLHELLGGGFDPVRQPGLRRAFQEFPGHQPLVNFGVGATV
jgi:hypothetical protein